MHLNFKHITAIIFVLSFNANMIFAQSRYSEFYLGGGVAKNVYSKSSENNVEMPSVPLHVHYTLDGNDPLQLNIMGGYRQTLNDYVNFAVQGNVTTLYFKQTKHRIDRYTGERIATNADEYYARPLLSLYFMPEISLNLNAKSRIMAAPKIGIYAGIVKNNHPTGTTGKRANITYGFRFNYNYDLNEHFSIFLDNNFNKIPYISEAYKYSIIYQGAIGINYRFWKKASDEAPEENSEE